jgi:glycosyltransferase involved in cell wall biosynthesis
MHASMIWLDPIALDDKLRTASFCVSISEYNRQYVLKAYGQDLADKIHVIHCGVDADQDRPNISCVAESSVMRIGSVGQFNRRKGFHILLPALAELRDRGLDFKCTIIGDGEERPHLKSLAQQLDLGKHVHFAGAMLHEDVKKALPSFDIFVLPCVIAENGYRDGIPVALMEAMYFELPVVSTNILGLPELIDEGVSGILVEPGEISPLADALHALANSPNLRATLGRNGKAKVLAEFNNELSARELKSLFEQST